MKRRVPEPDPIVSEVFGAQRYTVSLLLQISTSFDKRTYSFVAVEHFAQILERDVREGMRIYWSEMLQRAHWAAAASLVRSAKWVEAILDSYRSGRILPFAAAFRGFMESSADTNYSLNPIALSLAQSYNAIRNSILGRQDDIWLGPEIE